eukprot:gene4366-20588_t
MDFEDLYTMDLDEIKLDFNLDEVKVLDNHFEEFMHCNSIDIEDLVQVRCLAAPFFPDQQKHRCTCNEVLRKHSDERDFSTTGYSQVSYETDLNRRHSDVLETSSNQCDNDDLSQKLVNTSYDHQGAAKKSKYKSVKIEDFLLELLNAGGYESYIHWTMKERREFKITRPQRVANLWGDHKGRKLLSDDKLTRALRYSIRKGKLEKTDSQQMQYRFT